MTAILVSVPANSGVTLQCSKSLWALQQWFYQEKIACDLQTISLSDIAYSRSRLATTMVERPEFTHLLFVDSDMEFRPSSVRNLIKANKPLIGCVYPQRSVTAKPVVYLTGRQTLRRGVCQVTGVGMGLCLIERSVLERMLETRKIPRMKKPLAHLFFVQTHSETDYMSEDFAFCQQWSSLCGGETYALVGENIGHVGQVVFRMKS